MPKNLVDELSELAAKGEALQKRKAQAEKRREQKKEDEVYAQAKKNAPAMKNSVLADIKAVAGKGQRKLNYSLAWNHPGFDSLLHQTACVVCDLLSKEGLSAVVYFHHERVDGGQTGDSYDEDDYGIAVWGW